MAIKHDVVKTGSYIDDPNSDDAYTAFSSINEAFKTVIPTTGLPVNEGGTGATTAAAARTNLGLGDAATRSVGTSAGRVMQVGAFGIGSTSRYLTQNPAAEAPVAQLDTTQMYGFSNTAALSYGHGLGWSAGNKVHFIVGGSFTGLLYHVVIADKKAETRSVGYHIIRTAQNTTVDSNGFLKKASPIVELYADKIELNDEAKLQNITFEKLGIGDYLIKDSSGFAQEGWYVEQPKDANGNIYHAVVYDTLENGDISVKTYEQKLDGVKIVADLDKPEDIKENRFISIRLQELPQEPIEAPQPDTTITDSQGSSAPSHLHELEEGEWVISDENAAVLEQDRLAAMPSLKRRQFRLTLAMNGFDLNEIEGLINQIEVPMQRTIAQIEWQDATDFERTNPTLLMMASKLGLDTERIDELWSFGLSL